MEKTNHNIVSLISSLQSYGYLVRTKKNGNKNRISFSSKNYGGLITYADNEQDYAISRLLDILNDIHWANV